METRGPRRALLHSSAPRPRDLFLSEERLGVFQCRFCDRGSSAALAGSGWHLDWTPCLPPPCGQGVPHGHRAGMGPTDASSLAAASSLRGVNEVHEEWVAWIESTDGRSDLEGRRRYVSNVPLFELTRTRGLASRFPTREQAERAARAAAHPGSPFGAEGVGADTFRH